jgi:hypothetical protein
MARGALVLRRCRIEKVLPAHRPARRPDDESGEVTTKQFGLLPFKIHDIERLRIPQL